MTTTIPNQRALPRKSMGFTLLETLFVLALSLVITAAGTKYVVRHTENMANKAAADHLQMVSKAANEYARANHGAIMTTLSGSPTATVSVATLKAQGYLPASVSVNNNYNQTYSIRFVQSGPDAFEGVVVTQGGETVSDINKRKIAQALGAAGGYVDPDTAGTLTGSHDAWTRPVADFGLTPGDAELAYGLFVEASVAAAAPESEALSRTAVAGKPELNQMQTALDMSGNNVANVGQLTATGIDAATATVTNLSVTSLAATDLTVSNGFTVNGYAPWHSGNFDPNTKADANHFQHASTITGVMSPAQIPSIDASKVSTGVFRSDQMPVHDAGLITSGFLDEARIQYVQASKVSGVLGTANIPNLNASVITSGTFLPAQIPALDATKITTGTFAGSQIPNLDAAKITTGTFAAAQIPDLDAGKITTGVLGLARIPVLDASRIPSLDASKVTTGTFGAAQIPALDASKITTGTFAAAQIPGLDASKITSGVLALAQIPVLDASRIPNLDASKITSGVFGAGQIPALDASKITSGTFDAARIPVISQAQVANLVSDLASKAQSNNPSFTGELVIWNANGQATHFNRASGWNYIRGEQTIIDTPVTMNRQVVAIGYNLNTTGATGWYNESYGGGFYMQDTTWIRAHNNKNIYTGGTMEAGTMQASAITSWGNVSANGAVSAGSTLSAGTSITAGSTISANGEIVGQYLRPTAVVSCAAACSPAGALGITSAGAVLNCQAGTWKGYACGTGGAAVEPPPTASCDTCPVGYSPYQYSCRKNTSPYTILACP